MATDYDRATASWSYGKYFNDLGCAHEAADPEIIADASVRWVKEDIREKLKAQGIAPTEFNVQSVIMGDSRLWERPLDRDFRDNMIASGNDDLDARVAILKENGNFKNVDTAMPVESLDDLDVSVSTGFSWTDKPDIARQLSEVRLMYDIEKDAKLKSLDSIMRNKVFKDVVSEIEKGSFMVYYQPKVDSRTGITVGAEALIRFFDEAHGVVGPIHFIEILEENRCSHLIDLFVLDEVCKAQKLRCISDRRVVPVSVNFSKNTLEYADLLDQVKEIMNRYDLPEGLVQIEITESVGDMDIVLINNIAQSLISMGFRLSMDDFGTKYSNLEMLFKFPFSIAKIDRSLVKNLESNEKSRIMLKHLISMIMELGIECVAEGAENEEQVRLLQQFGCNIIQGYFYSKPVTLDVFTSEFVEKTRNQL